MPKPIKPATFKDAIPRPDLATILNASHTGLTKCRADCEVEFIEDGKATNLHNHFDLEIEAAVKAAKTLIERNKCAAEFEVLSYRDDTRKANAIRVVMRYLKPA